MEIYLQLVWALTACVLLFFSFAGWGKAVLFFVGEKENPGMGGSAAFGMAILCLLGGWLNFFRIISPPLLWSLTALGLILISISRKSGSQLVQGWNQYPPWVKALGLLALVLIILRTFDGVLRPLNPHDDLQSYLVYPAQMLSAGHLLFDPFNEGRFGILGGQSFLNAMLLAMAPVRYAGLFESVLGWWIFLMLVLEQGRRRQISGLTIILFLIIFNVHVSPQVNISSLVSSLVLFFVFWQRCLQNDLRGGFREVLLKAVLIAALVSLKTVNLFCVAVFGFVLFLLEGRRMLRRRWGDLGKIVALTFLFLCPWMVVMNQSVGTFLFPLLGQGTHVSWQQGAAPLSIRPLDVCSGYIFYLLIIFFYRTFLTPAALLLMIYFLRKKCFCTINQRAVWGLVGVILGALVLTFISLGDIRYSYPFFFAAFVLFIIELFSPSVVCQGPPKEQEKFFYGRSVTTIILIFFFIVAFANNTGRFVEIIHRVKNLPDTLRMVSVKGKLAQAQHKIPEGQAVLAVLSHPYALDFRRNPCYVIDHAGSTGPDGGLPVKGSVQDLKNYLRRNKIFFILYSYSDLASYGKNIDERLNWYGNPIVDRARILAENNVAFRKQLLELIKTSPVIYKDDYCIVLFIGRETDQNARDRPGFSY
ncbi:MAG TPA: hypothetical protein VLJ10_00455 [Candidatus Bathyarchaeia archaeon]|nr:hypothetical protein [Candidatus Bathyarchaeia archaeon]